jgi:hypothetical protein
MRVLYTEVMTMPYVVLLGQVDMEEVFRRFKPVLVKTDKGIAKATDAFMDRGRRTILVDSLAIEGGVQTRFMMMLSLREDGLKLSLWPGLEVKMTDGVKTVLAETAKQLLEVFPDLEVGEADLGRYLD